MTKLPIVLPLILLLAGCGLATTDGDPAKITARSAEWDAAMNARDIDALAALYTDNARLMAPNAAMTVGEDGIRAGFGSMIDAGLSVKLTSIEALVSGDIGHNVGRYVLSADGEEVDVGKFVETWERGADGVWRIANDIYNSDRPAGGDNEHLVIVHEVENADRWLAAWRGEDSRHKLFAENGAAHVHTFLSVDTPNLTGLVISVNDMGALQEMLESEAGMAAAEADGVQRETMRVLRESE
jgi:ketosteroid isomerase-like protein